MRKLVPRGSPSVWIGFADLYSEDDRFEWLMARTNHLQIGIMVSQITWDLMEAMKTVRSFILQTEVGMT